MSLRAKDIFQIVLKRVRAFLFSRDALTFCFFCLFAALIWYIHGQATEYVKSQRSSAREEQTDRPKRYTEKTLDVPITVEGVPEDKVILLFAETAKVEVHLTQEQYSTIQPSDLRVVGTFTGSSDGCMRLKASCSIPSISVVNLEPTEVEYIIQSRR